MKTLFSLITLLGVLLANGTMAAGGGSRAISAPAPVFTQAAVRRSSGGVSKMVALPLSEPSNVVATSDGKSVTLSWQDAPEFTITHYLAVKDEQPMFWAMVLPGQQTFIDTNVTLGKIYTYKIRALTDAGTSSESSPQAIIVRPGSTNAAMMPGQTIKSGVTVFKPVSEPRPTVISGKVLKVEDIFPVIKIKKQSTVVKKIKTTIIKKK